MNFRRFCAFMLALLLFLPALTPAEETPAGADPAVTDEEINAFFGNTLFIGDSITKQLYNRVRARRGRDENFMKGARFVTAQSYQLYVGSRRYLTGNPSQLMVAGHATPLWEVVSIYKPDYVFILLGVNDYIGEKIDTGLYCVERIHELIAEKCPDTKVVFISLTPVTRHFCRKKDYRTMWDDYNAALEVKCAEIGAYYLEAAEPLKDEEGYLPDEYSSDNDYHLSDSALDIWIGVLNDFAAERIIESRATGGN